MRRASVKKVKRKEIGRAIKERDETETVSKRVRFTLQGYIKL